MGEDEAGGLGLRGEGEGDLGIAPCETEEAGRVALKDVTLDSAAVAGVIRGRLLAGEGGVVEVELDLAAGAEVHGARGEPCGAFVGVREVGPNALDGSGQEACEAQFARVDEFAVGVVIYRCHWFWPGCVFVVWLVWCVTFP